MAGSNQKRIAVTLSTLLTPTTLEIVLDPAPFNSSLSPHGFTLTGLSGGATTLAFASISENTITMTVNRSVDPGETGGVLNYSGGQITGVNVGPLLPFTGFAVFVI